MQAGQCAFLWNNPTWSDFTLHVLAADAAQDAEPLYTLKLQSALLAIASPGHFKEHCTRLREEAAQSKPVEAAPKRRKNARVSTQTTDSDAKQQQPYGYKLFLEPGEPQEVPRAVLCHLHTGELPDDPEQLIWMLRRADYLDLADTLHAALRKLAAMDPKQLTLQHALLLSAYPHYQCDEPRPQEQPAAPAAGKAAAAAPTISAAPAPTAATAAVAAAHPKVIPQVNTLIDSILTTHLPSAPAIVTDAALLAQFTQLPLALVERWVELDKYEVDSGNTLAVLFTAWHDAQFGYVSEQQCKQLSALLPLAAVSLCFHIGTLQHLKWWREPHVFACGPVLAHTLAERPKTEFRAEWLKGVGDAPLAHCATQTLKHTWTVDEASLKELWESKRHDLPGVYFAGRQYGMYLTLQHMPEDTGKTGPLHLGLRRTVAWPEPVRKHMAVRGLPGIPGDMQEAKCSIDMPLSGKHFTQVLYCQPLADWGWSALPALSIASMQDLAPAGAVMTVTVEFIRPS